MYVNPYPPAKPLFPSIMARAAREKERKAKQAARDWFNNLQEDQQKTFVELFRKDDICTDEVLQGLFETINACTSY